MKISQFNAKRLNCELLTHNFCYSRGLTTTYRRLTDALLLHVYNTIYNIANSESS